MPAAIRRERWRVSIVAPSKRWLCKLALTVQGSWVAPS